MAPLVRAEVLRRQAGGLLDATSARLGPLGGADPLEDPAPGRAREGVPVAAGGRARVERRAEVRGLLEPLHGVQALHAPFAFAASTAAAPAGAMRPDARSRAMRS